MIKTGTMKISYSGSGLPGLAPLCCSVCRYGQAWCQVARHLINCLHKLVKVTYQAYEMPAYRASDSDPECCSSSAFSGGERLWVAELHNLDTKDLANMVIVTLLPPLWIPNQQGKQADQGWRGLQQNSDTEKMMAKYCQRSSRCI